MIKRKNKEFRWNVLTTSLLTSNGQSFQGAVLREIAVAPELVVCSGLALPQGAVNTSLSPRPALNLEDPSLEHVELSELGHGVVVLAPLQVLLLLDLRSGPAPLGRGLEHVGGSTLHPKRQRVSKCSRFDKKLVSVFYVVQGRTILERDLHRDVGALAESVRDRGVERDEEGALDGDLVVPLLDLLVDPLGEVLAHDAVGDVGEVLLGQLVDLLLAGEEGHDLLEVSDVGEDVLEGEALIVRDVDVLHLLGLEELRTKLGQGLEELGLGDSVDLPSWHRTSSPGGGRW